jgi:hypothetical protein
MSDVTDAPEDSQPAITQAAPVAVEVPAKHETLFRRIAALIHRDEQWLIDNIDAGITHFESMFKDVANDQQ